MYGLIGGISVFIMVCAVICNFDADSLVLDIVKDLAIGCVASTLVASLIEIGNTKEKNEKAYSVYDAVFIDLKWQIMWYIESWARLCSSAFKDQDYTQEKHTWIEWYEITKNKFNKCDANKQAELLQFFREELLLSITGIEKALKQISDQQYILYIHGIYDEQLNHIMEDYDFEFDVLKTQLENNFSKDDFWKSLDAMTIDLAEYIYDWNDIRYYNYQKFNPHKLFNEIDIVCAMLESEKDNRGLKNIIVKIKKAHKLRYSETLSNLQENNMIK